MVTAVLLKDSLARVSRYGSDAIIAFIPSIMEFSLWRDTGNPFRTTASDVSGVYQMP